MYAAIRALRLIPLSVWRNSLDQWSWHSFVITLVLDQAIGPIIGMLVWTPVLPDSAQVRTYFFILLVVQLMTVSYEDHTFCTSIFDGTIIERLLLPQPVIVDAFGVNLSLRFWHTVFGLPILAAVAIAVGLRLDLTDLLFAAPAVVVAGMLRFLSTIAVAITAFWTERATALVSLANIVTGMLGGAAAPIFLLPNRLADLGRLLPFWPMLGMPGEIAASVLTNGQILAGYGYQLAWLIIFAGLVALVWRGGLRRFTAVGA
jgi:ABC-2 type transport system permease protein